VTRVLVGIGADVLPVGRRRKYTVTNTYADAIRAAGGLPVGLLPPEREGLGALLERVDALLLAGGYDMHPRHWCEEEVHPEVRLSSEERTLFELDLVRRAVESGTPLLGICLGCQTINVALGGGIVQHLDSGGHRKAGEGPDRDLPHEVEILPGTRLHRILGVERMSVASEHHQAIGRVADGLLVAARSPDGVIEALEGGGEAFVLGVQWHPELHLGEPGSLKLFEALVEAAL
jgi:gamma-glutamyl-gamma-aminobutyrate hydrolase PuuD